MKEVVADIKTDNLSIHVFVNNPRAQIAIEEQAIINWASPIEPQPVFVTVTLGDERKENYEGVDSFEIFEELAKSHRNDLKNLIFEFPLDWAFIAAVVYRFDEPIQEIEQLEEIDLPVGETPNDLLLKVDASSLSFGALYSEPGHQKLWKLELNIESMRLNSRLVLSNGTGKRNWCRL